MIVLKATQDKVLSVLQSVAGIVERRHTLPILANVLIRKTGNAVQLTTSDLEIQIRTTVEMDGDSGNFTTTVGARKLIDILRTMPGDQTVSLESSQAKLILKGGKSRFTLQTLPAEDFPLVQEAASFGPAFSVPQKVLKDLLNQVSFAMAVHDIRYYLNGLLLQTEGNQVRLIATDGHRLAFASAEIAANLAKSEVILPRKTIVELYKLLQDSDEQINVELLSNQVRFSFGSTVIISKIVDGKFPDYNRVIPLDNNNIFLLERVTFLQALQRAAILANEKFRGVRLVLRPGTMSILCTNSEQEEAEEELEIAYQGAELEIGFNINYLLDVLTNLPAETVQLAFGDAVRAVLVTIPDNATFKYVVMPMRI